MKQKLLFIGCTILMNLTLSGQDFISSGKQWNVRLTGFGYSTEIFNIEGDSVVNAIPYRIIQVSYDSMSTWTFQGLLREDANVVYYIPPNMSEGILYDFTLGIGDTAQVKNIFCGNVLISVHVTNIDTVTYFGVDRKRWHLEVNGGMEEIWIEGIGSINGPLYTKYWQCIVCPVWELLCFHDHDTLQYIRPGETSCFQTTVGINEYPEKDVISIKPNPVKKGNTLYITTSSIIRSICVYNTAGLPVKRIEPITTHITELETNTLGPGLFFITLTTANNTIHTKKILVD